MTDGLNPLESNDNEKSILNYFKSEFWYSNTYADKSKKISDEFNCGENILKQDDLNEYNKIERFNSENSIIKDFTNKIFNIEKVPKLGRLRKTALRKGKHDKLSQDNLIRRFKAKLINNLYEYINSLFNINNYGKSKTPIIILKKVNPSIGRSISKIENLEWLETQLKNFFSNNVSIKFSNYPYDYNEKLIIRIYEKKQEKKVISILEKKIIDMLDVYRNDDKFHTHPGFKTLKDDIEALKKQGESNQYIQSYILIAQNFEKRIKSLIQRRKRNN